MAVISIRVENAAEVEAASRISGSRRLAKCSEDQTEKAGSTWIDAAAMYSIASAAAAATVE